MSSEINERVSGLLRAEKSKKNSSRNQKALASALNVSAATLSGWLLKGRDIPARHLTEICNFFGVSMGWLLGNEPNITAEYSNEEPTVTKNQGDPVANLATLLRQAVQELDQMSASEKQLLKNILEYGIRELGN